MIIPSKFREQLGEEFVLTKGLDGCLSIYPNDEWTAFEEKLRALPLTNKNARTFSRFFVAGATSCELDKQGRILLPATLREFAGLDKDVVLAGVNTTHPARPIFQKSWTHAKPAIRGKRAKVRKENRAMAT